MRYEVASLRAWWSSVVLTVEYGVASELGLGLGLGMYYRFVLLLGVSMAGNFPPQYSEYHISCPIFRTDKKKNELVYECHPKHVFPKLHLVSIKNSSCKTSYDDYSGVEWN